MEMARKYYPYSLDRHDAKIAGVLQGVMQVWVRSNKFDLGYKLEGGMNLAPALTEKASLN